MIDVLGPIPHSMNLQEALAKAECVLRHEADLFTCTSHSRFIREDSQKAFKEQAQDCIRAAAMLSAHRLTLDLMEKQIKEFSAQNALQPAKEQK